MKQGWWQKEARTNETPKASEHLKWVSRVRRQQSKQGEFQFQTEKSSWKGQTATVGHLSKVPKPSLLQGHHIMTDPALSPQLPKPGN